MSDAAFMHEVHSHLKALVNITHDIFIGYKNIGERAVRMVCGHVEGPQVVADLKSRRLRGGHETADAFGASVVSRVARKNQYMARFV